MYQGYLNEMPILKKEIKHIFLQNSTLGDLNEIDKFKMWTLIIHVIGYTKLHGTISTKMKIIKRDTHIYYLVDLFGWKH